MEGDVGTITAVTPQWDFNPLPPHGGRHNKCVVIKIQLPFQSTPSAWRETWVRAHPFKGFEISIHSLRMEGDPYPDRASTYRKYFNPLPPHGGRQRHGSPVHAVYAISIHSLRMEGDIPELRSGLPNFISIHSLRMEGDTSGNTRVPTFDISIHSLRMEGDIVEFSNTIALFISIHSLRMEGDLKRLFTKFEPFVFQSTPSAWRETMVSRSLSPGTLDFNPLPPHGGRLNSVRT